MATAKPTLKQQAHALIDKLPDTATWDDVIEEARFRKAVEEGIAQADRGEFAKPEDVRAAFAKWGVKLET
jgi:predicted transcriptional regulator